MPPPVAGNRDGAGSGLGARGTVIVIVEVPEPGAAIDEGLKLTVTPDGMPDADNAIAELKPPETVVVIVTCLNCPGSLSKRGG